MGVGADLWSLIPCLQYDGRIEEARAPPSEARETPALTRPRRTGRVLAGMPGAEV